MIKFNWEFKDTMMLYLSFFNQIQLCGWIDQYSASNVLFFPRMNKFNYVIY